MNQMCKFCHEALAKGAKKCKTCGEPFYFAGKVLKWVPLVSIVVALCPFVIAFFEIYARQKAVDRAQIAEESRLAVTRELHSKERAADDVIREIARKLPEASKNDIIKDLRLPPRVTLEQLEKEAKRAPENSQLQRKVFLYRALRHPE